MTNFSDEMGGARRPDLPPDAVSRLDDATWAAALRLVLDAPAEARAWAGDDPARVALLHDLTTMTGALHARPRPDSDAAWSRLRAELDGAPGLSAERRARLAGVGVSPNREPAFSPGRSVRAWPRWMGPAGVGIAGAAIGLAAIGLAAVLLVHHAARHPSATTEAPLRYATRAGQLTTVSLSDGSRVTLSPQTTLLVDRNFGTAERHVTVDGEAYFDVAHATATPFVVHAGRVAVRVLGTAFDVRVGRASEGVRVAVVSGKVGISRHGAESSASPAFVPLTANMIARVTDSAVLVATHANLVSDTAWVHGALTFDGTPASEVLATVGRWYGYEFRLPDSTLAKRPVTARFQGESQADVLRTLSTLLDVTMRFDGHVITLSPGRRADSRETVRGGRHTTFSTPREVGR